MKLTIAETVVACIRAQGLRLVNEAGETANPADLANDIANNAAMALEESGNAMMVMDGHEENIGVRVDGWSPAHGDRQ